MATFAWQAAMADEKIPRKAAGITEYHRLRDDARLSLIGRISRVA